MNEFGYQGRGIGLNQNLMMSGAKPVGDKSGIRELAVKGVLPRESNGIRIHRLGGASRHERHQRPGVESAAEKSTERHIADELPRDRLLQCLGQKVGAVILLQTWVLVILDVPIAVHGSLMRTGNQVLSGKKLAHMSKERRRRRNIAISQEILERVFVQCSWDGSVREKRLDLRREPHAHAVVIEVEGLDANPVTCEEQFTLDRVPDGEGEHSVEK